MFDKANLANLSASEFAEREIKWKDIEEKRVTRPLYVMEDTCDLVQILTQTEGVNEYFRVWKDL